MVSQGEIFINSYTAYRRYVLYLQNDTAAGGGRQGTALGAARCGFTSLTRAWCSFLQEIGLELEFDSEVLVRQYRKKSVALRHHHHSLYYNATL